MFNLIGRKGFSEKFFLAFLFRVCSHMVSVRIHCTEKLPTSFHNNVLSKSKWRFLLVFHLYPEIYTPFSSLHFVRSNDARIS